MHINGSVVRVMSTVISGSRVAAGLEVENSRWRAQSSNRGQLTTRQRRGKFRCIDNCSCRDTSDSTIESPYPRFKSMSKNDRRPTTDERRAYRGYSYASFWLHSRDTTALPRPIDRTILLSDYVSCWHLCVRVNINTCFMYIRTYTYIRI